MPKSGLSGSVRGAPSNGRPYRDVRRETGEEYVVKVHCDEGAAVRQAKLARCRPECGWN